MGGRPENCLVPRFLRRRSRLAAASIIGDDPDVTEDELILQIKYKCTVAAARFRSSHDEAMPEEMRAKDWQMFLDCREYALSETAKLTDEFSMGFAQHQVVKMLTVAGEDDLARNQAICTRARSQTIWAQAASSASKALRNHWIACSAGLPPGLVSEFIFTDHKLLVLDCLALE